MTRTQLLEHIQRLQQQAATLNDQFRETLGALSFAQMMLEQLPEDPVQVELLPVEG